MAGLVGGDVPWALAVQDADMQALIFDLDGTLVDTVYAHVFAWQRALDEAGLPTAGGSTDGSA